MLAASLLIHSAAIAQRSKSSVTYKKQPARLAQPRLAPVLNRLHFCGEAVPTQQGDVSARLATALAGSSGYARHLDALKARSAPYFAVIEPILQKHNIPNDFKYLPLIESAWQANAVSKAGAVGYWQFMDETAQDMGLSITPGNDERTDLRKSTEAACKYIRFLYGKLGSWTLVAAAYNGGIGMVQRKVSRTGHRDYYAMTMNAETGYYLYRILAMKELMTNPAYGLGSAGLMLASVGNAYEQEREQARRMGWLRDSDPEPVGVPIESMLDTPDPARPVRSEAAVMDSLLVDLLKNRAQAPTVFSGDVSAELVRAGTTKIGQRWSFKLTENLQIGEDELKAGDILYALVDDVDTKGNLFLRVTKALSSQTQEMIPVTLIAINPATGLAGIPRPKTVRPGWEVQWKL